MVRPTPRYSLACPQALRHVVAGRDVCGEREHEKYVTWIWLVKRVLLRILNGMVQTEMVPDYSSQAEGGYDCCIQLEGCLENFGLVPNRLEVWHSLHPCAPPRRPRRTAPRRATPRRATPRRAAPRHCTPGPRRVLRCDCSVLRNGAASG